MPNKCYIFIALVYFIINEYTRVNGQVQAPVLCYLLNYLVGIKIK